MMTSNLLRREEDKMDFNIAGVSEKSEHDQMQKTVWSTLCADKSEVRVFRDPVLMSSCHMLLLKSIIWDKLWSKSH